MRPKNEQPSVRMRKVASLLSEKISEILRTEEIEGLKGIVTIREVEVTPDLKEAKVWFTSLGQEIFLVEKILNRHLYSIQGSLYHGASMRIVPKVKFFADTSVEYAAQISGLLDKIHDPLDSTKGHGERGSRSNDEK